MKPTATVSYTGELRTKAIHTRSSQALITDAPIDNKGKGEAFSPTDLLATALVSCMITVMGIRAQNSDLHLGNVEGAVEKIMVAAPRRVAALNVEIVFSGHNLGEADKTLLEQIAINCPVAKSIHPDIAVNIKFTYD